MSIDKPEIDFPGGEPPADLEIKDIWEGEGEVAQAGQTVTVHYVGVAFSTGEEFDSTYSRKALTSFSLQQVVKGWAQGLTGKKVGSRVLIVIPPDLGYGDNPPSGSGISKDSTLVFTVDILAKM